MLKKITLILTLLCMLVLTATGSNRRFTLVIDPGHGGHDVGARGAISVSYTHLTLPTIA